MVQHRESDLLLEDASVYIGESNAFGGGSASATGAGAQDREQLVEPLTDIRAGSGGVVLDEVLEEVWFPHLRVVTEKKEQHPRQTRGDLMVPLPGVIARGVGLLHSVVHPSHEFRGSLRL